MFLPIEEDAFDGDCGIYGYLWPTNFLGWGIYHIVRPRKKGYEWPGHVSAFSVRFSRRPSRYALNLSFLLDDAHVPIEEAQGAPATPRSVSPSRR